MTPVRTILWVFGPTGVGKASLIKKLAKNEKHELYKALGVQQPMIVSSASDKFRQERRQSLDGLLIQESESGTLLVKGQHVDYRNEIPQKVARSEPGIDQKFIFLYVSGETLKQRQRKRHREQGQERANLYDDLMQNVKDAKRLGEVMGVEILWFDNEGPEPVLSSAPEPTQ